MDEQETVQLNESNKVTSDGQSQETEPDKGNAESQLEGDTIGYENSGAESEVITVVSNESDGEVYVYEKSETETENASTENPSEYVQVSDSSNAFDEVTNSEDVNVDGVEVEESEKRGEGNEGKERTVGGERTEKKGKENGEENGNGNDERSKEGVEGGQTKNYKNVILEDWEIEVSQANQNHDSGNRTSAVEKSLEENAQEVAHNNENCVVVETVKLERSEVESELERRSVGKEDWAEERNSEEKEDEEEEEEEEEEGEGGEEMENSAVDGKENSVRSNENLSNQNESENCKDVMAPRLSEKKLEALKYPKSVTKEEIVKILDDSSQRLTRPIVGGKDLFFSIELTKRLNQKLSLTKGKGAEGGAEKGSESDSCNNNTVDDRQKIVEILEADEIKDWKSIPSKSDSGPKENGNDMEISKAIKSMERVDSEVKTAAKTPRKTPLKKVRTMDKELERTLALQQLREEFPSTRKRSRTSKKLNHVPFLASTVLEKAMTSPEVSTALKPETPKRRPCYLPENVAYVKGKETPEGESAEDSVPGTNGREKGGEGRPEVSETSFEMAGKSIPNAVVKTYSAKRKSTDAESEIKTTLEAVAKALSESSGEGVELKPKKQKTGTKESKNKVLVKKKKKVQVGAKSEKKMKSELEKLLGDEGAVRMLYDTQHGEASSASPKKAKFKTTTGLKKDLVLKTKLVKNAVMRLSGVGADGVFLRGKRRSNAAETSTPAAEEEPLFSSTPNIVLYKPKKKQRAEASRILYRHSSSESFESSEGYRRTSFELDGVKVEPTSSVQSEESTAAVVEGEKTPGKGKVKKSELLKRRLKSMKVAGQRKAGKANGGPERLSTDSLSPSNAKLDLSNVPIRKSSRPRVVSKKYSVWSSTSMDSLSVESLGLKKLKKASTELGKKLNCKHLTLLQYENFVQVVLTPATTVLKNSLGYETLQELHQVFSYLSEEDSCRAVLITSRGSTFCQGVDINTIISFTESEREKGISQLVKAIREFVTCLSCFTKPVIAGVQGAAVGLGVTLLPYCDVIICSDTASFYTPYVKMGQAPEGAPIHTFPRINRHLVSELLFRSRKLTAADAFKYGLVSQVIPEEQFERDLIMASRNMASQSVQGMQSLKYLLRKSESQDVSEALQAEGELLEEHWKSSECLNNMIRFLESGELQLKQSPTA